MTLNKTFRFTLLPLFTSCRLIVNTSTVHLITLLEFHVPSGSCYLTVLESFWQSLSSFSQL